MMWQCRVIKSATLVSHVDKGEGYGFVEAEEIGKCICTSASILLLT